MELIHSLPGVLIEQHEILQQGHARTMELLKRLKAGEVKLEEVELTDTGWKIKQPQDEPEKVKRSRSVVTRR